MNLETSVLHRGFQFYSAVSGLLDSQLHAVDGYMHAAADLKHSRTQLRLSHPEKSTAMRK
jgi:hypothetical protein